jgi:hypothetical protein
MLATVGMPLLRGIGIVSGKCSASSRSVPSSRRIRPGNALANAIARRRPGIVREAAYDETVVPGRPSDTSVAIVGANTW